MYIFILLFTKIHAQSELFTNKIEETLFILIHGTWSHGNHWHSSHSRFFKNIEKSLKLVNGKLIGFCWDGKLSHDSRKAAGKLLAEFIENQNYYKVSIIAHSHGVNVAIIASQILGKSYKKIIKAIYSLGCPIDIYNYMPNMHAIEYFYNFYSYNDYVQTIFGLYDRKLPHHPRISNIQIMIDEENPNHTQIHAHEIAYWLPFIHHELSNYKIGNFHKFKFGSDCIINFFSYKPPELILV